MRRSFLFTAIVAMASVGVAWTANAQDEGKGWRVMDALGNPIPKAAVRLWRQPWGQEESGAAEAAVVTSDADGGVELSANLHVHEIMARLEHADYGVAESRPDIRPGRKTIVFPLVKKNSAAEARALKGVVRGPDDQPLAGARVSVSSVRTPGEGLIGSGMAMGRALTDKDGRFTIYPPKGDDPRAHERGDLVPANSSFYISTGAEDSTLFPSAGVYNNSQEAVIRLERPQRAFRLVFLGPDGKPLPEAARQNFLNLTYSTARPGSNVALPKAYLRGETAKLLPGRYAARYHDGRGTAFDFDGIEVTDKAPDELIFRPPRPVTFAGRVSDGLTGNAAAGAFVIGMTAMAQESLAQVTPEEWQALHALPAKPPDGPALDCLRRCYGFHAIVRTDAEGRFEITQPPGEKFYTVLAFDEWMLPLATRVLNPTPDLDGRMQLPDIALFPAAKIAFQMRFAAPPDPREHVSVSYDWILDKTGQPDWLPRFPIGTYGRSSTQYIDHTHWLRVGAEQTAYVPAGLRFRLRFDAPYNDNWSTPRSAEVFLLKTGETKRLEDLALAPSIAVTVQVTDARGKPIEGAPVRRKVAGANSWSIVHNTDAQGVARFFVPPNSSGTFGMPELRRKMGANAPDPPETDFTLDAAAPAKPYSITLTDQQVEALTKAAPAP